MLFHLLTHASISLSCSQYQTLKDIHDVYAKYLALADLKKVLEHVRVLETAGYLEDVLWPHVALATAPRDADSDNEQQKAWVLSVMMLVNYKLRESAVDVWSFMENKDPRATSDSSQWEAFVATLLSLKHGEHAASVTWSVLEKSYLVQFLINCYQSLEIPAIAKVKCIAMHFYGIVHVNAYL